MRKLKTVDAMNFCRCIKRIGLKDQIREITMKADKAQDILDQGFDIIWTLFDVATEQAAEKVIYEFLAGPFEMTPEQVGEMDLDDFFSHIQQLAAENNLTRFFKTAAGSMK